MNLEIKRKFLINKKKFFENAKYIEFWNIQQGYISKFTDSLEQKISICKVLGSIKESKVGNIKSKFTIKYGTTLERKTFSYDIPEEEARELYRLSPYKLQKSRIFVPYVYKEDLKYIEEPKLFWEIDIFKNKLEGLIIAEIEIPEIDFKLELPDWIEKEITDDKSFYNSYLACYGYAN